ncbi:endonuclease, partial [Bacillus sp. AY2-1]
KNNTLDKNIGIVFEVQETDYTNRKRSWETLNWFHKNITGMQTKMNYLEI